MVTKRITLFLTIGVTLVTLSNSEGGYRSYGPEYKATIGQVWPQPLQQNTIAGNYFALDPNNFELIAINQNCNILRQALLRYTQIIKASARGYILAPATPTNGSIRQLHVNLTQACEQLPHLDMDESYFVWGNGRVVADSIWGILRGLETLSQLLVPMPNGMLRIPDTAIYDKPRFKYRGLMLDTARHFISKAKILQLLEGMAYNKFNVLHWHMTDDSAFPYKSKVFPELAEKGAYRTELTYSMVEVVDIVELARMRGIRVVPEFDTPAHTASWGASHPEIMTTCAGNFSGQIGPLNPTLETTYNFLKKLFTEIKTIFPDEYLHLGMDEVDSACWESNVQIQKYLDDNQLDTGDLNYLYLERFTAQISTLGWRQIVWQEAMLEHNVMEWPRGTIAQVWFDYRRAVQTLTKAGHDVIMSDGWYLYVLETGADWEKFYKVEPLDFRGSTAQMQHVIGGEACLWSEYINEHNVLPTTFPRASAVAERLWSERKHKNVATARLRLEEHNCRMLHRGIAARPANSFGIC